MSASVGERRIEQDIELGTVVNWPPIIAALGLGAVVLAVTIVIGVVVETRGAPEQNIAQANIAPSLGATPPWTPAQLSRNTSWVETQIDDAAPPAPTLPPAPIVVISTLPPAQPAPATQVSVARSATVAEQANNAQVVSPSFKRRFPHSERDLLRYLNEESREIDLDTQEGTSTTLMQPLRKAKRSVNKEAVQSGSSDGAVAKAKAQTILDLFTNRDDFKGLPVREQSNCELPEKEAAVLRELSTKARKSGAGIDLTKVATGPNSDFVSASRYYDRDTKLAAFLEQTKDTRAWHDDIGTRTMGQMFQAESYVVRSQLIKTLSATKGKNAGLGLAQLAVFDLDSEIREAAVKALRDCGREEYWPVLLAALRYPWARAADHAAEALVALDDRDAIYDLVPLLDAPDPRRPTQDKEKQWVTPELVRVNHLGNCMLCHAPSSSAKDPVRGLVPERGKTIQESYCSGDPVFIRADVTYVKQDFSVLQTVSKPDKWPSEQRFDYLIRQRPMSDEEVRCFVKSKKADMEKPTSYPQREAVLWALRELTGEDAGDTSDDWYSYLLNRRCRDDL